MLSSYLWQRSVSLWDGIRVAVAVERYSIKVVAVLLSLLRTSPLLLKVWSEYRLRFIFWLLVINRQSIRLGPTRLVSYVKPRF
jgi:hypothetical protein